MTIWEWVYVDMLPMWAYTKSEIDDILKLDGVQWTRDGYRYQVDIDISEEAR